LSPSAAQGESHALRDELRGAKTELISSILLSVEGRRAARRYGKLAAIRANAALTTVTLLALDQSRLTSAARTLGIEVAEPA
jgi:hypothetical protein